VVRRSERQVDADSLLRTTVLLREENPFRRLEHAKTVPPLSIDVETGGGPIRLTRDFPLPDLGTLRLEILPLDPSMPKHQIKVLEKARGGRPVRGKPAEPVPGNKVPVKGQVIVVLTKENTPRVAFDIAFDTRGKDVWLEMRANCEIMGSLPFNFMSLQRAAALGEAFSG